MSLIDKDEAPPNVAHRGKNESIKALDRTSVHRITSGQVVVDLQTAVKELVENSLDAGATSIEVRFKDYGLQSIEVVDNGCGIAEQDWESVALKHHTSKLSSFSDLSTIRTFGFRGEALSSLCALSDNVTVTTSTTESAPMGTVLSFDRAGRLKGTSKIARQRGTTTLVSGLFSPLPVRRKELERNVKREYGKALGLLNAYALVPCAAENKGIRLSVYNQPKGGKKSVQIQTTGAPSTRASISALWGPKALENLVDLDIQLDVTIDKVARKRISSGEDDPAPEYTHVGIRGLISKFQIGCGRTGTDRQFFFVNGRPWNPGKVQKAFNEVYRSYNIHQSPFIVADFLLPGNTCDINVSPDKRTIFIHSEINLIQALKDALEQEFSASRSTFGVSSGPGNVSRVDERTAGGDVEDEQVHNDTSRISPSRRPSTATSDHGTIQATAIRAAADATALPIDVESGAPEPDPRPEISDADLGFGSPQLLLDAAEPMSSAARSPSLRADSALPPASPLAVTHQIPISAVRASWKASPNAQTLGSRANSSSTPRLAPSGCISAMKPRTGSVQMVLDTRGAGWNLSKPGREATHDGSDTVATPSPREGDEEDERPSKRQRSNGLPSKSVVGKLRSQLSLFAQTDHASHIQSEPPIADDVMSLNEGEDIIQHQGHSPDGDVDAVAKTQRLRIRMTSEELDYTDVDVDLDAAIPPRDPVSRVDGISDISSELTVSEITTSENLHASSVVTTSNSSHYPPEFVRTYPDGDREVLIQFDVSRVSKRWSTLRSPYARDIDCQPTTAIANEASADLSTSGGLKNADDNEKAADALARVITKSDFETMDVLGQFNLGFIITRRRQWQTNDHEADVENKPFSDDLFIIDQHAADEKYNFETLQQTTKIQSQRLFRPRPLELTAADELVVTENIEVLRQNGFDVAVDENASFGQGRLQLVAQPVSKNTVFDMKDLEELLHLMQDRPTGRMVRCSKAQAMFASRACRKSVMIGDPLTRKQMRSVVRHMGTMDQPWNCPHGRPTMRHLSDLRALEEKHANAVNRTIDWQAFE